MTAHKFVWPMFLLGFAVAACEEKAPATSESPAAEAKPAEAAPAAEAKAAEVAPAAAAPVVKEAAVVGPSEVCGAIIEAAKAKDEGKILSLSTPATGTAFAAQGAKDHVIKTFGAASCGSAKVEGERATVTLAGTTPPQEATFVKAAEGWKFDGAAFFAKYPAAAGKEAVHKAAGKVEKKAAAIKKGHHPKKK